MSRTPEQEAELQALLAMDVESMIGDQPYQWAKWVWELAPEMADQIRIVGEPEIETGSGR